MKARSWLAAITGVIAALGGTGLAEASPRIAFTSTIGGPGGAAGDCPNQETDAWPIVAADSTNPARLRAVYQRGGVTASMGAASSDGGRTWTRAPISEATACAGGPGEREISVNPQLAVGRNGIAYYGQSWVGHRDGTFAYGVLVHQRDESGSWQPPAAPATDGPGQNAAVVADATDPRRVSVFWTDIEEIPNPFTYSVVAPSQQLFATSMDAGVTWSTPVVVSRAPHGTVQLNTRMVQTSAGSLVATFDRIRLVDAPRLAAGLAVPTQLFAVRSDDGGRVWSAPARIGRPRLTTAPDPDHGPHEVRTAAGSLKTDLAAGPRGLVAAAWTEGGNHARLAVSRDDGVTWSVPFDGPRGGGRIIQPAVALDGRGNVGLFYYDLGDDRAGDDAWQTTPRVALSDDIGASWETLPLSQPFDLHATNDCGSATGLADPLTQRCAVTVDFMAIGVFQSVVGLDRGFGVGYTVGPPVAQDGFTDARYARVLPGG